MSSFLLVPSAVEFSESCRDRLNVGDYTLILNGYFHRKVFSDNEQIVLIGSPYLDYENNEEIGDLCNRIFLLCRGESFRDIALHGFCTAIVILYGRVVVITDLDGYKPVYSLDHTSGKILASKIDSFNSLSDIKVSLNSSNLYFSLVQGFFPGDSSVYEEVQKRSGGTIFVHGDGKVVEVQAKFSLPASQSLSVEDASEDLASHMEQSIRNLTSIDNKVAVLLGGFDSALVAAIASRVGFQVETFSFYYENSKFNQDKVNELCDLYNIKHNWVKIDSEVIRDGLRNYRRNFSQPTNWPNYIIQSNYLGGLISRKGYKICLTGDGCDGLFQGYPGVFRSAKVYNSRKFLTFVAPILAGIFSSEYWEIKLGHVYRLLRRVYSNGKLKNPEKTFLMYRICDEKTLSRVFRIDESIVEEAVSEGSRAVCSGITEASVARIAYMGKSMMGPNRAKLNGISDATDLYVFSPYMHWSIKGFVNNCPEEYFRPKGDLETQDIGKYILTRLAREKRYLGDEIIFQKKKSAVDAPIDDWYENELREFIYEIVDGSKAIINKKYMKTMLGPKTAEKLYRKFVSSDAITSHALSLILTTILYET